MDICLCDITALECIREMSAPGGPGITRCDDSVLSGRSDGIGVTAERLLTRLGADTTRTHIVVARPRDRINRSDIACHVWQGPYPTGSFIDLGGGICSLSPEMTFVWMARHLSLAKRALLAFELAGRYSIVKATAVDSMCFTHTFVPRPPVTSIDRLRSFAHDHPWIHGARLATDALRFASDGAESPAEARLALATCMPHTKGGYARGPYRMAHRVDGTLRARRCDLYLERGQIDLEYQSTAHHSTEQELLRDLQRSRELNDLGITVVDVRYADLVDPARFHKIMERVARLQGEPLRIRTMDFEDRRRALWEELFPRRAIACGPEPSA